jgi:hypothetical protein
MPILNKLFSLRFDDLLNENSSQHQRPCMLNSTKHTFRFCQSQRPPTVHPTETRVTGLADYLCVVGSQRCTHAAFNFLFPKRFKPRMHGEDKRTSVLCHYIPLTVPFSSGHLSDQPPTISRWPTVFWVSVPCSLPDLSPRWWRQQEPL